MKYYLNSGTNKLHNSGTTDKRCKKQTHRENIKYFETLESVKNGCDVRVTLCALCMKDEIQILGKKYL